ncbi:hypothetical protein NEDG_00989 [Nematocida displodere]|uniref:Uncharacterized protein n=1 Tax=Nematocida displodere TaxID=1805483 RepID=A0A177EBT6_9MICR|nr:hypothetical protein NEDG_00989 [Nematocida displodere]
MRVPEVQNANFQTQETPEKRRRKRTKRSEQAEESTLFPEVPFKTIQISEFTSTATNKDHKTYRQFLAQRKNGERVSPVNFLQ